MKCKHYLNIGASATPGNAFTQGNWIKLDVNCKDCDYGFSRVIYIDNGILKIKDFQNNLSQENNAEEFIENKIPKGKLRKSPNRKD